MKKIITYWQFSPLIPLKGRIITNINRTKLVTNAPFRGLGVNTYDNF